MRLTEYGREPHKRKEYVPQPALLLVGVDGSKAKHKACLGTQTIMSCRKLGFTHTREGFQRFEQTLRDHLVKTRCQRLLIAMEPSGIDWRALSERLKSVVMRSVWSTAQRCGTTAGPCRRAPVKPMKKMRTVSLTCCGKAIAFCPSHAPLSSRLLTA